MSQRFSSLNILNQGLALPLFHLFKGQTQFLTMGGLGQYVVQFMNSNKVYLVLKLHLHCQVCSVKSSCQVRWSSCRDLDR